MIIDESEDNERNISYKHTLIQWHSLNLALGTVLDSDYSEKVRKM